MKTDNDSLRTIMVLGGLFMLFLIKLIEEYGGYLLMMGIVGIGVYAYIKWSEIAHYKQRNALELLKLQKEIQWGDKEINFREIELKLKTMELYLKAKKAGSKAQLNEQTVRTMESELKIAEIMSGLTYEERKMELDKMFKRESHKMVVDQYLSKVFDLTL